MTTTITKLNGENKMTDKMNRADLEVEILNNDDLYKMFDKDKLMASKYSDDELRDIIREWILAGDECEKI